MDVRRLQSRLNERGYPLASDGIAGPRTWAALFAFVGRARPLDDAIVGLGQAAARWFGSAELNSDLRIAHALAQWAAETGGFSRFEENLNYTAARLCKVWPKRFPTPASAQPFAGNPKALANKVYGRRMGNEAADDGWRYRGRGPTMLTGRANYREASALTELDLIADPDAVLDPDVGLRVACAYWAARKINRHADRDDIEDVTQAINGGQHGLVDRKRFLARAKLVLSC